MTKGGRTDGPSEAVDSRRTRRQFAIPPVEPGAGSANGLPRHSRESGNPWPHPPRPPAAFLGPSSRLPSPSTSVGGFSERRNTISDCRKFASGSAPCRPAAGRSRGRVCGRGADEKSQSRCISMGYAEKAGKKQGQNRPKPGPNQAKTRGDSCPETACRRAAASMPPCLARVRAGGAGRPMRRRAHDLRLQGSSSWETPLRATKNPAGRAAAGLRSRSYCRLWADSNTDDPQCQAKNSSCVSRNGFPLSRE